jgi:hypothetical protein
MGEGLASPVAVASGVFSPGDAGAVATGTTVSAAGMRVAEGEDVPQANTNDIKAGKMMNLIPLVEMTRFIRILFPPIE